MTSFHSAAVALALLLAALPDPARAQPAVPSDTTIQELRRADGSRTYGRVVAVDHDRVVFESLDGIRMEMDQRFVRLRPARGRLVDGEFWHEDRNGTRLFFAPTGRTVTSGEGYGGLFLFLPFVAYGATDDLTLAGGIPPAGSADGGMPVWIAPKLRVHDAPQAQISAGVFAMYSPGYQAEYCDAPSCEASGQGYWDAVAYGIGTFGDQDNALHAGAGVARMGEEGGLRVPIMVGGERRVSRRNKLITENWLIPGEFGASMVGMRWIGERWTTDVGWMFLFDAEDVPYFPILSVSYAFGGR